ncbi:sensor histidine kinase, partial [bacterium]|nr:sensor histidine kinase [bacterium]
AKATPGSAWPTRAKAWISTPSPPAMGEAEAPHGGLGLTVARRIAQRYGGGLALQSNPATGTVAAMWLPSRP